MDPFSSPLAHQNTTRTTFRVIFCLPKPYEVTPTHAQKWTCTTTLLHVLKDINNPFLTLKHNTDPFLLTFQKPNQPPRPRFGHPVSPRQDALSCAQLTGCAAVMSAEALLEQPDLFAEADSRRGWRRGGMRLRWLGQNGKKPTVWRRGCSIFLGGFVESGRVYWGVNIRETKAIAGKKNTTSTTHTQEVTKHQKKQRSCISSF